MNDERIKVIKKNMIAIGRLLWERDLASGLNGNISVRVDDERILLTATKTCLGLLQERDILLIDREGKVLEEGAVSTETPLHTAVYRDFEDISAIVHSHTTFTNAYFLQNDRFCPEIFESKIWFGDIQAIAQHTPCVRDVSPVLGALKDNNIAVLKNHGVLAIGKNLFDCFLLIQSLEDAIKVDAISRLYRNVAPAPAAVQADAPPPAPQAGKKYELFSQDQMESIVRLVNADERLQALGGQTKMTMGLAVKLDETGQVYSFDFENGRIKHFAHDPESEFLISAPAGIWRAVFNGQIDPFVATTQKKMHLRGDFAKISQWYEPCCRIFEIFRQVPVEEGKG